MVTMGFSCTIQDTAYWIDSMNLVTPFKVTPGQRECFQMKVNTGLPIRPSSDDFLMHRFQETSYRKSAWHRFRVAINLQSCYPLETAKVIGIIASTAQLGGLLISLFKKNTDTKSGLQYWCIFNFKWAFSVYLSKVPIDWLLYNAIKPRHDVTCIVRVLRGMNLPPNSLDCKHLWGSLEKRVDNGWVVTCRSHLQSKVTNS